MKRLFLTKDIVPPIPPHHDFTTPEYSSYTNTVEQKWEATRGLETSFGYNRAEKPEVYLKIEELVRFFVDIVSKNGNFLLNLSPEADGTIPDVQKNCMLGLGKWLETNGQAIFGTRLWARAEGITTEGIEVRFTRKSDSLFALLLDTPRETTITIKSLIVAKDTTLKWFAYDESVD